jgi:two-component system, chemotaxis family, chemotaxis protein CheY
MVVTSAFICCFSEIDAKGERPIRRSSAYREYGSDMKAITALIVDDSSVMRKIVERSLRQAGLEFEAVLEASNGKDALEILQEKTVDLVLSDINMPVMNGLEFVENLQKLPSAKNVPVIMITTEGSESNVLKALSCGARGYIRKPFTPDEVKQQVLPIVTG